MTTELWILLWGAALGLVHIMAAAGASTMELGIKYNLSSRDDAREVFSPFAGRLQRAQANFFETFPLLAAAILVAVFAGETGGHAALGGWIWLIARILYLPVYAFGIPVVRTLIWAAALVGLVMVWLAAAGVLA